MSKKYRVELSCGLIYTWWEVQVKIWIFWVTLKKFEFKSEAEDFLSLLDHSLLDSPKNKPVGRFKIDPHIGSDGRMKWKVSQYIDDNNYYTTIWITETQQEALEIISHLSAPTIYV